jgi:hypothetical protein
MLTTQELTVATVSKGQVGVIWPPERNAITSLGGGYRIARSADAN